MPLIIPKTLPAYDALYNENIFVMHRERALAQHIRSGCPFCQLISRCGTESIRCGDKDFSALIL